MLFIAPIIYSFCVHRINVREVVGEYLINDTISIQLFPARKKSKISSVDLGVLNSFINKYMYNQWEAWHEASFFHSLTCTERKL